MDEDQLFAFDLALKGHNLCITGQAGTGKSFLVRKIVEYMRFKLKRNVSLVCSTGIAGTHYENLGAQTIHKWSGVGDGRYLNEEIVHLVRTDERYLQNKTNILSVETLIVDEISMVSAKVLNQVQTLCKQIRNSEVTFGNIQVILVGDFMQLPPVANEIYGDPGTACFRLSWFESYFPHKINLHIVHRQDEPQLIQAINEIEAGDPSDLTIAFIKSLERPTENENSSIQLFARNFDVDTFNYNKLQTFQGEEKMYTSVDSGSDYYLKQLIAPKHLALKVGCQVLLLKNISDVLVNGLRGTVTQINQTSVQVKFVISEKTVTTLLLPESFSTYDPVDKALLAKRVQIPLKLAYAITIHKAQGMSLENVTVNCQFISQPGQLGVAIGRAVSIKGLRVVNFKKHYCKKHPQILYNFYDSFSIGNVVEDLSCCRNSQKLANETFSDSDTCTASDSDHYEPYNENCEGDSDFSDSEIEHVQFIDDLFRETGVVNEELDWKKAFENVIIEFLDTPNENHILKFKEIVYLNPNKFCNWFTQQESIMDDVGLNCFPEGTETFSQKHRNDYFIKFNAYLNSNDYKSHATNVLIHYQQILDGPIYQLLVSILFYLQSQYLLNLESHLKLDPPKPIVKPAVDADIDSSGKSKIRYVSGYVLAKLKHNLSKRIRNSLFVKAKKNQIITDQDQMTILTSLCATYDELSESCTDPSSLYETKRKQNSREGLTNVSDYAFGFFQTLELRCREELTHLNLVVSGKNLYAVVKDRLLNDSKLFEAWMYCVSKSKPSVDSEDDVEKIMADLVISCENCITLFHLVVDLFLRVSLSQFRRDFLTLLRKEKGKALRKKVSEKIKKSSKNFDMKFYNGDKSVNKQVSFLRMKSELIQNKKFFHDRSNSFTKKDLILLCKDLKLEKISTQANKGTIIEILMKGVMEYDSPLPSEGAGTSGLQTVPVTQASSSDHPPASPVQQPSLEQPPGSLVSSAQQSIFPAQAAKNKTKVTTKTSKSAGKRRCTRGKGKGKGKRSKKRQEEEQEDNEHCGICSKGYVEGEQWISCDICEGWYHRQCVNLEDDTAWEEIQKEEAQFTCPMCM